MNARKTTGWAVLSLIPAIWITTAILARQVPEMLIGAVIAFALLGLLELGIKLTSKENQK